MTASPGSAGRARRLESAAPSRPRDRPFGRGGARWAIGARRRGMGRLAAAARKCIGRAGGAKGPFGAAAARKRTVRAWRRCEIGHPAAAAERDRPSGRGGGARWAIRPRRREKALDGPAARRRRSGRARRESGLFGHGGGRHRPSGCGGGAEWAIWPWRREEHCACVTARRARSGRLRRESGPSGRGGESAIWPRRRDTARRPRHGVAGSAARQVQCRSGPLKAGGTRPSWNPRPRRLPPAGAH